MTGHQRLPDHTRAAITSSISPRSEQGIGQIELGVRYPPARQPDQQQGHHERRLPPVTAAQRPEQGPSARRAARDCQHQVHAGTRAAGQDRMAGIADEEQAAVPDSIRACTT